MPSLSNLYLVAYNSVQAIAWAVCLSLSLSSVLSTKGLNGAYASVGDLIYLCQMVAFLEVVHGAIGLVPSGVVFPLMQWAGRANCIYLMRQTHEVQELPAVLITFVAWSISEVIRYPNYALNCIGSCPPWLTYLRYTAFLVLYPPGMGGETWLMYQALPFMKKYSFSYYNFLMVLLFCYPFLCVKLYLHMVKQRRSKLGKQDKKKKRKPSLSNLYLFAYNSVQAIAWAVCLSLSLSSVLSTKGLNGAYASAGDLIFLCQMVAFLEVLHGAIGLVPSGVVFPLMQLAGRANCVCFIRQTREVQELPAVLITFVDRSISEIIRYSNYALNCIGSCPPWLTYLRYTAFLVLYPPGMCCETWLMYQALPFMKKYSFSYYNFLMVVLFCYPFFCVKLYLNMVKQRRSNLGKQDKKKQKVKDR